MFAFLEKSLSNFYAHAHFQQSELVQQLYNTENIDELLAESEQMTERRKEATEMLEALDKANKMISEVRETQIW